MVGQLIGILALQGGFEAHRRALQSAGYSPREVRVASDLDDVAGLVLPGGESTVQLQLIERHGLRAALDRFAALRHPILATCAGLILSSRAVEQPAQPSFNWLDVRVARNGWGRQIASFTAMADDTDLPLVFIRAPRILEVGPSAQVLARYRGEPVLVREGTVTGATFHPELTGDLRVIRAAFERTV